MKKILKLSLYVCFAFSLIKSNVCISQNSNSKKHNYEPKLIDQAYAKDENDVKVTIKHFLAVKGNYHFEAMEKIMTNKASYSIHFSDGPTAFVKSDAMTYVYGVPLSHNIDYFTLKKESDIWKIVNTSFNSTPITSDKMNFDLMTFAKDYAQAWCSHKPNNVALFFTEDGSLAINNGKRSIGRSAVAKDAESFMNMFPDIIVSMDSLISTLNGIEFHWTLTGTNTGTNGTGKKVKISGFELWQMDNNGLIKQSKGSFDAEDYNRQLKYGVGN
jgi:predicted ester cyclase